MVIQMQIEYKDNYAIIDGLKFRKDKKTGYYLSTYIEGKRIRLHRYMYEKYKGKIPKGYEVHHIDHNKDNNDIENLVLLSSKEHKLLHGRELTKEQRDFYRRNINENARPKAIEWHKSKKATKWHKEHYEKTLGARKPIKLVCEQCGKTYEVISNGTNRFCSNKCKAAWRREKGLDDETRQCIVCGKEYRCNKYAKTTKCYNCTPDRYKKSRKR